MTKGKQKGIQVTHIWVLQFNTNL